MQSLGRATSTLVFKWSCALCLLFGPMSGTRAASLPIFAPVFQQLTNEIESIEADFENSPVQNVRLATLIAAQQVVLDPEMADTDALQILVGLLGGDAEYADTLDEAASNARAVLLGDFDLLGARVIQLPPSPRANQARNRFDILLTSATTLVGTPHAAGIVPLLQPFAANLVLTAKFVTRAETMPLPIVGQNTVRGTVDGQRFASAGDNRRSPNNLDVSAPNPLYLSVSCRVLSGSRVINFTLPVVTDAVRYEVAQGLATLTYAGDIFTNTPAVTATNGTFYVQRNKKEIYGVFSAEGPGLQITDGRFRIKLPRELRGR